VNPETTYPFLTDLLWSFHKARRKTLGLVIAAVAVTSQARSFAAGGCSPLVGARHLNETRGNLESEEVNVGLP
jgi:hypothetical protein